MIDTKEAIQLIERAFDTARNKGRPDWQFMTVAVLKNRLLSFTKREFDPCSYGAKNFEDLLVKLYPWIQLKRGESGLVVEWRGEEVSKPNYTAPQGTMFKAGGVRSDLWASIVDYRSGTKYVWDHEQARAREGSPKETLPLLPTLTTAEMKEWRSEFLELHKERLQGADLASALRWKEQPLSTATLPESIQKLWNRELTRRVRSRLEFFFGEQTDGKPSDGVPGGSDVPQQIEPPLLDEAAVKTARDKGQVFVAGEILAQSFPKADDELLETLLARVIAA